MRKIIWLFIILIIIGAAFYLLQGAKVKDLETASMLPTQEGIKIAHYTGEHSEPNAEDVSYCEPIGLEKFSCENGAGFVEDGFSIYLFKDEGVYTTMSEPGLQISFTVPRRHAVLELKNFANIQIRNFSLSKENILSFSGYPIVLERINHPEWQTEESFLKNIKSLINPPEDIYNSQTKDVGDRTAVLINLENHFGSLFIRAAKAASQENIYFFDSPGWYRVIRNTTGQGIWESLRVLEQ